MLHDVLYLLTAASCIVGPWDPPSRIELGPVSYRLLCVIDATGTASAVLLLCFAAATDSGSSKAAATQQCHCRRQPRGHQYVPPWCYRLLMTSATHTAAVFTAVFAVELINLITSINR